MILIYSLVEATILSALGFYVLWSLNILAYIHAATTLYPVMKDFLKTNFQALKSEKVSLLLLIIKQDDIH